MGAEAGYSTTIQSGGKQMTKNEIRNLFYDGFNSKLIETAFYDSVLEIPKLDPHEVIEIPEGAVPFSKRKKRTSNNQMLVFYEQEIGRASCRERV